MNELKTEDAEKLFREVSQAMSGDDSVKLSELMNTKPSEEKELPEDQPTPKEEEPEETDEENKEKGSPDSTEEEANPDDEAKETTEKKEDTPSDDLAKLKEQLEKLTKENHVLKSAAGRVPQVQRKIHELDKKLEELSKQTSPSSQTSAKIKPKVDELLKGVKDTDPELAAAIAAVINEAVSGVAEEVHTKELETLKLLRNQEHSAYQEAEVQRLLEMYPNAPEVFASKSWAEWKESQSKGIKALADSDTADDVAYAFEKYAADMKAKYPELNKQEEKKAAPTPNAAEAERAKQLENERKRKQANTPNIRTPNASGKVNVPDDPQALFDKYASEIRKQRMGD